MPTHSNLADDSTNKFWSILASFRSCMLVSRHGSALHGRPMAALVRREEGCIYFLTDKHSLKDAEISENPNVYLAFSDGGSKHVSVYGMATLDDNSVLIQKLWSPAAQAFWPNGPDNSDVVSIRVTPESAEYWDGSSAMIALAKMAFAAATGSKPDLGENKSVVL